MGLWRRSVSIRSLQDWGPGDWVVPFGNALQPSIHSHSVPGRELGLGDALGDNTRDVQTWLGRAGGGGGLLEDDRIYAIQRSLCLGEPLFCSLLPLLRLGKKALGKCGLHSVTLDGLFRLGVGVGSRV